MTRKEMKRAVYFLKHVPEHSLLQVNVLQSKQNCVSCHEKVLCSAQFMQVTKALRGIAGTHFVFSIAFTFLSIH